MSHHSQILQPKLYFTDEENSYIMDNHDVYRAQVGPGKMFRNQKGMWTFLANEMNAALMTDKTWEQLQNRYKTMLRSNRKRSKKGLQPSVSSESDSVIENTKMPTIKRFKVTDDCEIIEEDHESKNDKSNHETSNDRVESCKCGGSINSLIETLRTIHRERQKNSRMKEAEKNARHKSTMALIQSIFGKKEH